MTKRIFQSILSTTAVILLISFIVITAVLYNHFENVTQEQLKDELSLAAQGVEQSGVNFLKALHNEGYRITWVSSEGIVLYDTKTSPENMDNHLEREEIKEAFETGKGESTRYSNTLTEKTLYYACQLSDGTVLRISAGINSVFALLLDIIISLVAIFILAIIISVIVSRSMAKGIVKPLNELDLDNPTQNEAYEELSPMLTKIGKQHKQISEHINLLQQKNDEFQQIISSMNEGLVLLNKNGITISMNSTAKKVFGVENEITQDDFLIIDRTPKISEAVKSAIEGKNSEFRIQKNDKEYQFGISSIKSNGDVIGVVIICFDITEQAFAERKRQEFTANVSHELKTPLQSIIGSAELLENGLVKSEDMSRFIGHIKNEATRLVSLINDIIRLSQLDEDCELVFEDIDLREVAQEVVETLNISAIKRNVEMSLQGEQAVIKGVRRYIYEIIYNLCDNGIRYNVEGGKVIIDVQKDNNNSILSVTDTGIGISAEHHSRIFERFYRVDKSHSKDTGGTGLGLSIVKHAVMHHNGRIEVDSAVGKGTRVRVTF